MDTVAFVFSGQGAQYSGMGKELYQCSAGARAVFNRADAIRPGTAEQCFKGNASEIFLTVNTQPCVFCVDLAAAFSLREAGITPRAIAGFSLGEMAALTFAEAFDFDTGFRFVCKRAAFMQAAAEKNAGAMVAVVKLKTEEVRNLCAQYENAYPVNYNCVGQTVVALAKEVQEGFCKAVQAQGGRAVPLAVSGGFHSPFMDEASKQLEIELQNSAVQTPNLPVYANATAKLYGTDIEDIKATIAAQVNSPVYWQKTIENMIADGITTFIEVGAGKTLCGLIKKISPQIRVLNVEKQMDLEAVVKMQEELC
jgi:[acyl-carrier-protein] S-malonyltransferase